MHTHSNRHKATHYSTPNLAKIPTSLLTLGDEQELSLKTQQGDLKARNKLIIHNLRLVINIAKHYKNRGIDLIDLIAEGNLGLIHATYKFDPQLGFRFATYAAWWIRQNIEQALMEKTRLIHIPAHIYKQSNSYIKMLNNCSHLDYKTTLACIAEHFHTSTMHVQNMLTQENILSIDAPVNDNDVTLLEALADPNSRDPFDVLHQQEITDYLEQALSQLSPLKQDILCRRFGIRGYNYQTLEEIGLDLNLTRERVRQTQIKALKILFILLEKFNINKHSLH